MPSLLAAATLAVPCVLALAPSCAAPPAPPPAASAPATAGQGAGSTAPAAPSGPATATGAGGGPGAAAPAPAPPSADAAGATALRAETVLDRFPSCLQPGRGEALVTDQAAWRAWADRVTCGAGGDLPAVDFATAWVVAVDGEDGSNGCHAVRIERVTAASGGLVVDVVRYLPPPDAVCAMVMVHPVHAVRVARPEGVAARAEFRWRTVVGRPTP